MKLPELRLPPIFLDFELRSDKDITIVGAHNYLRTPNSDILMMGWRQGWEGKTQMWFPTIDHKAPEPFQHPEDFLFFAFNMQFEEEVIEVLGPRYGFKILPLENQVDAMAVAGRYGFRQSLEFACIDTGCKHKKNPSGKNLIKKITQPPFEYTDQEWREFCIYCRDDVDSMVSMLLSCPRPVLSDYEQRVWQMSCIMNKNGLPVDVKAARQIDRLVTTYVEGQNELLPDLTDGMITKVTQVQRIKKWVNAKGYDMPNTQAETVSKMLKRDDVSDEVKTVLQIRSWYGGSATAKYKRLYENAAQLADGTYRLFRNSRYWGAHTGRWTGLAFNMLNLPRKQVKDPEAEIQKFFDLSIIEENPVASAKALLRPMIVAPPGRRICCGDYSSIEYVLLCACAGESEAIEKFRAGQCTYSDMGAFLHGLSYDEVYEGYEAGDKEMSGIRFEGKVIILGCGYGMGANKFAAVADSWGLKISSERAQRAVTAFRQKYPLIPKLWYRTKDCVVAAIMSPGKAYRYRSIQAKVLTDHAGRQWLRVLLPSGRPQLYAEPKVHQDKYGWVPSYMGINPTTKQRDRKYMTPGLLIENIVQAIARDILVHGKLNLLANDFMLIGSIYDEIITEVPDLGEEGNQETLDEFLRLACELPDWATDISGISLPLRATGYVEKRYRKD